MTPQDFMPGLTAVKNIHPMLVHLPLGLWPTSLAFLLVGAWRGDHRALFAGRWTLHLATLTAIVASASGIWGWTDMESRPAIDAVIREHRNWMLTAGSMSAVASLVALGTRGTLRAGPLFTLAGLVAIALGIATIGADLGSYLVFGEGVGTSVVTSSPDVHPAPATGR